MQKEAYDRYKQAAARTRFKNRGWGIDDVDGARSTTSTSILSTTVEEEEEEEESSLLLSEELLLQITDDKYYPNYHEESNNNNVGEKVRHVADSIIHGIDDLLHKVIPSSTSSSTTLRQSLLRQEREFVELTEIEGDAAYVAWLDRHLWTYVGLSPPLLGASNTVRCVLSGEKMGLPMSEELARRIELTFG